MNAQIIPRPLYLETAPPKSSLLTIPPFKRHVHIHEQSHDGHMSGPSGSTDADYQSNGIPMVLRGNLNEVCLRLASSNFNLEKPK